jgi:hypothetical protein
MVGTLFLLCFQWASCELAALRPSRLPRSPHVRRSTRISHGALECIRNRRMRTHGVWLRPTSFEPGTSKVVLASQVCARGGCACSRSGAELDAPGQRGMARRSWEKVLTGRYVWMPRGLGDFEAAPSATWSHAKATVARTRMEMRKGRS